MCQPHTKIIITVYRGIVECENCPMDIDIELHDYDIDGAISEDSDQKYGHDDLGDYAISEML